MGIPQGFLNHSTESPDMKNLQSAKLRRKIRSRSAWTYRHQTQVEALESRTMLSTAAVAASYAQIPMSFEANAGQTAAQVQYLARGAGYTVFLTPDEAVVSLEPTNAQGSSGAVVQMQWVGANGASPLVAEDQLTSTSNYLIGNDPSDWHTTVPNFGQVDEQGVYPGVNLTYHGNQQQLEYEFTIEPGTSPAVIRLAITGAESIALDAQGDLVLQTVAGDLEEPAPVLYQEIDGARQAVSGNYVLEPDGQVGFAVGAYDASQPLVIDPTLAYSSFLGGDGNDQGNAIAVDSAGNVYVTGFTTSDNFPEVGGIPGNLGNQNVFVSKLNAAGTALIYSTYIGGEGNSQANGIAVNSAGNAYITGSTDPVEFPTTAGAFMPSSDAENTGFVAELSADGSALIYSTYLGGTGDDEGTGIAQGNGIAVDSAGNAYVVGTTDSVEFPTTAGAFQTTHGDDDGEDDAFVTKLNAEGSGLIYSTYLGGDGNDEGNAIAIDASGDAFITGSASSDDFPTTAGAFQTTLQGETNAFVTKLSADGSALIYSTYIGGDGDDAGNGIAVNAAGDAYITGTSGSDQFPTTANAFQQTLVMKLSSDYVFVTELNAAGTALIYSTYLAGSYADLGYGIAVDSAGDAWVTGIDGSGDFPTTADAVQPAFIDDSDAFVSELNPDGTALEYSTYLGGTYGDDGDSFDSGQAIAVDSAGNVYVTGLAGSGSFPFQNALQSTFGGGEEDAFITKFATGQVTSFADSTTLRSSASSSTIGQMVTFTATVTPGSGSTGTPTGTVTFEEGTTVLGTASLSADGTANFAISTLALGSDTITAVYSGDTTFAASSGNTSEAVNQAGTTTTLSASPNSTTAGQVVTLTATVAPGAGSTSTPTGIVTFEEGTTVLGTAPVGADGKAIFTVANLAVGTHTITAAYGGSADFVAGSGELTLTVAAPAVSSGPTIKSVKRFGFHRMPTVLVLTFDEALDSVTAENGKNYDIIDPNGHRDPIRRAVYDAATLTVTLNLKERISIHHPYQLIVNGAGPGAVSNMLGQPLDSVDAGQSGSSDHVVLTWRQLVLGDVSKAFRIRYGLVPKGPRVKIPSGAS